MFYKLAVMIFSGSGDVSVQGFRVQGSEVEPGAQNVKPLNGER